MPRHGFVIFFWGGGIIEIVKEKIIIFINKQNFLCIRHNLSFCYSSQYRGLQLVQKHLWYAIIVSIWHQKAKDTINLSEFWSQNNQSKSYAKSTIIAEQKRDRHE